MASYETTWNLIKSKTGILAMNIAYLVQKD